MSQEDLILNTLLGIKEDIGSLGAKIDAQLAINEKQDIRLAGHDTALEASRDFQTGIKAKTGVIGALAGGVISFVAWFSSIIIEGHKLK